jgi:hypothetical protein
MASPLHIYDNINGGWKVNPIYAGADGKADPYAEYSKASQAESGQYGQTSGTDATQDKLYGYLDKAAERAFGYQKQTMDLTNQYRTKEGATQGQIDNQAFKRLGAEIESRKYLQAKGADLTNQQRNQDRGRALESFKSIGN